MTETVASLSENFAQSALLVLQITFISAFALELITTLSIAIVAVSIGLRLLYGQLTFLRPFCPAGVYRNSISHCDRQEQPFMEV